MATIGSKATGGGTGYAFTTTASSRLVETGQLVLPANQTLSEIGIWAKTNNTGIRTIDVAIYDITTSVPAGAL